MALARRIDRLLNGEGYTVKGVQQLLAREGGVQAEPPAAPDPGSTDALRAIRAALAAALEADGRA